MKKTDREKLVRKYFMATPRWTEYTAPSAWWLAGVVTLFIDARLISRHGLATAGPAALAIAAAIIGAGLLLRGMVKLAKIVVRRIVASPKPTGAQMDAWLSADADAIEYQGRHRLNLHPNEAKLGRGRDTLLFIGIPSWWGDLYAAFAEDDHKLRLSQYGVLVVYLSDWRVSTYECVLDMGTGITFGDATKEFHLQQVDGLETFSNRANMLLPSASDKKKHPAPVAPDTAAPEDPEMLHITTMQVLALIVSGRRAIELSIGLEIDHILHREGSGISEPDQLIAQLRNHLRHHMGGIARQGSSSASIPPGPPSPFDIPPASLPGEH
jgi:hypothetical protein